MAKPKPKVKAVGGIRRPPPPMTGAHGAPPAFRHEQVQGRGEPYRAPHPQALDYAAWYLATVLCDQREHNSGMLTATEWPCKACMADATQHVHAPVERARKAR